MLKSIYIYIFKRKLKITGKNNITNFKNKYGQYSIKINGDKNNITFGKNFNCSKLKIAVTGNNNSIIIGDNFTCHGNTRIFITGNNNSIILNNKITVIDNLTIYSHESANNCSIKVGKKTSFYNTQIFCYDINSSVTIGQDCMFGYNTVLYNTDGHAIIHDGKIINQAQNMIIGNHVWLAEEVTILKNSIISNNTIIGRRAVVSGKFLEKNCALGGIPAKIIKKNIFWSRKTVNQFLSN